MQGVLDIQRDHPTLIRQCMALLRPAGQLLFSTNYARFRLQQELLREFEVEDISAATIPPDFARNARIHRCYVMRRRA